jgi:hypothetical protein
LLPTERSRQQFATDLLDQFAPEPANGAAGGAADGAAGEAGGEAAAERGDEAEAEPGDEAFGKPRDEAATEPADGSDPSTATAGPHRDIDGRSFENHSTNFELSLGRHQFAPVAKKKTWIASQRVRKKMCASTIPRHRAAICLSTPSMTPKTSAAAATTSVHNPRRGSRWTGGSKNCGIDGCGLNATAAPQDCGRIYIPS